MFKLKLHWQILIGLGLAVIAGILTGEEATIFGVTFYSIYDFIGTLFLNALKMIIVPLIVSSIIVGVAGIGGTSGLARLGGRTIIYYMTTSLFAILIGLMVVNLIEPGIVNGEPARALTAVPDSQIADIQSKVEGKDASSIADVFLGMFPPNIVAAAADGKMLGLIVFSLLFGFFVTRIEESYASAQFNFWQGMYQVMLKITELVIKFAPIGVFGLVAKVIAGMDEDNLDDMLNALFWFTFSVILALAIHLFIVLPLLLKFVARVNPIKHYQAMLPALLTAFTTASSSATLPLTMECVEKNAGVSNKTASFVLPLGATINMDGTALYECIAALFIAQTFGLELSFTTQFLVVLVALLTSIGVAGIPSASLVAITIILTTIGLPIEAVGVILAVDRILDMFRTAVNVFSDSCGAVIIARLEGEEGILRA
ncbi:Proton/glutamate symporter @ Sodium/glutamate symporter [hydrothermal vent metagenome]|uniref:Proton/glutamate symporter @ Sodium/glutamate symporter n=1 Tax=hydrothermal vent metagenome TaxID=652676 RepID=A0A3B0ZVL3_9ZZZZ